MQRDWLNIELPRDDALLFKDYLRKKKIKYESSEAFNLIHFECFVDVHEKNEAVNWIEENL